MVSPKHRRVRQLNGQERILVSWQAAEGLAFCGCRKRVTIGSLTDAVGEQSPEVRFFASHALGIGRELSAAESLKAWKGESSLEPGFGTVGEEAEWALRRIGVRPAAHFLC